MGWMGNGERESSLVCDEERKKVIDTGNELIIVDDVSIYQVRYTAKNKVIPRSDAFDASIVTNQCTWDPITEEGIIAFDNDITIIG